MQRGERRALRIHWIDNQIIREKCPVAIAQHLLEISNGSKFPKNSINKLRYAVLMHKFRVGGEESTAETLMQILDSDDTQYYVCHTGSYDWTKKLVRAWRKRNKKYEKPTIDDKKCSKKNTRTMWMT